METLLDFRPEQSTRAELQRISIILVVNIALAAVAIGVLTGSWVNFATICAAVVFKGAAVMVRHLNTAALQVGPYSVVHGCGLGRVTRFERSSVAQVLYIADPPAAAPPATGSGSSATTAPPSRASTASPGAATSRSSRAASVSRSRPSTTPAWPRCA